MAAPRFVQLAAGVLSSVAAAVTSAANSIVATGAGGTIDPSFFPAGIGQDIVVVPASEALAAGDLVNLWSNAGVTNARKADNTSANGGKKVMGFVLAAVTSSASASVYRSGLNTSVTGLTPGSDYYLGTAGGETVTPPTASGTTSQFIGTAITATSLDVQPQTAIGVS